MPIENLTSRLPAGSTLELQPGLNVPHPHAEVNLPGRPDNRFAGTEAVTETLVTETKTSVSIHPLGEVRPLAEEAIPSTLTTKGANAVELVQAVHNAETVRPAAETPAATSVLPVVTKPVEE